MEQEQLNNSQALEDNLPLVSYIMLHRIYDLLTIISNHLDPEKTSKMVEYHKEGYLLGPSPAYTPEENS